MLHSSVVLEAMKVGLRMLVSDLEGQEFPELDMLRQLPCAEKSPW